MKKLICAAGLTAVLSSTAYAGPSVNDMSACQATLTFIDGKIDTISKYDAADVATVKKGLKLYSDFIQSEHITPGILTFNGGDAEKAGAMQSQIEAYQTTLVDAYTAKFPQPRLFADHAVAINGCYQKAPMPKDKEQIMLDMMQTYMKLAKMG